MTEPGSLAHYEVVSALGKGGKAEVCRALDTKLGREVAIKTLPDEFSKGADRLARFLREARAAARLNHLNICAIYEVGEAVDGTVWRWSCSKFRRPRNVAKSVARFQEHVSTWT